MFVNLAIFSIGLVAGFLGATVGGGGFISIPAFLYLGFTPQSAIALNKFGDMGTFISAIRKYWKSKKIDWSIAWIITAIYIVGSFLGARIMVLLNSEILQLLIFITIAIALPLLLINPKLGIKKVRVSQTKKIVGYVILFFLSIMGAVIGAGGAVVSTLVMMYFFGYEVINGHATTTPSKLFSATIPSIIYFNQGFIPVIPGLLVFLGMIIGGFVGSSVAISVGNKWVKVLMIGVLIIFLLVLLHKYFL